MPVSAGVGVGNRFLDSWKLTTLSSDSSLSPVPVSIMRE